MITSLRMRKFRSCAEDLRGMRCQVVITLLSVVNYVNDVWMVGWYCAQVFLSRVRAVFLLHLSDIPVIMKRSKPLPVTSFKALKPGQKLEIPYAKTIPS